jgi:hypothetical protein
MGARIVFLLGCFLGMLHAEEAVAELRGEIERLTQRLDQIEKEKIQEKQASQQKGFLELSSDKTVLGVGGRIDLQSIWGWPEGALFADSRIPLKSAHDNAQMKMSARDSRLWVKSRTPTEYGPLRTLVEIDFWGSDGNEKNVNAHNPRLRHAYLQIGGLTVGQTNSAFNAFVTVDTISYIINDTLVRQPLIRLSLENDTFGVDLSFEQPETTLVDKNGVMLTPQDDVVPDIVARVRYYPAWGEAALALIGRYIAQDHTSLSDATQTTKKDSAFGYGVNLSAKIKTFDRDDIRLDAQYGKGMGRYLAYDAYAAGFIDDTGNITLQESFGWHAGYRHYWAKTWRSTLAWAYAGTKNDSRVLHAKKELVNKSASSIQANLFWDAVPNGLVGVEYAKGVRKVFSGAKGDIDLALLIFRYDF